MCGFDSRSTLADWRATVRTDLRKPNRFSFTFYGSVFSFFSEKLDKPRQSGIVLS